MFQNACVGAVCVGGVDCGGGSEAANGIAWNLGYLLI